MSNTILTFLGAVICAKVSMDSESAMESIRTWGAFQQGKKDFFIRADSERSTETRKIEAQDPPCRIAEKLENPGRSEI